MKDTLPMASLEDFRAETRTWLEANCPASMRTPLLRQTWRYVARS